MSGSTLRSSARTPSRFRAGPGIGRGGTLARAVVGSALLADVIVAHATGGWPLGSWVLALVVFPGAVLAWQARRARTGAPRLVATGPVAHVANLGVFLALYLGGEPVPALEPASDAALIFYAGSMLLAAVRGYPGCEVLAVSNWLLGRDDQVGCAVFFPVDVLEHRHEASAGTDLSAALGDVD